MVRVGLLKRKRSPSISRKEGQVRKDKQETEYKIQIIIILNEQDYGRENQEWSAGETDL